MPSEIDELVTCCAGLTKAMTTLTRLLRKLLKVPLFGDDDG